MKHETVKVQHEVKIRELTVKDVKHLTPKMLRMTLGGDDLADFTSLSPADHLKLFFTTPAGDERRDYTPRKFDIKNKTLTIDFAIHEAGPATAWALKAKAGDKISVGGPKGSKIVPADFDWWLLVGDETALPSIGRRLEELPEGTKVITVIAVTGKEEEQKIETKCNHQAIWIHRPAEKANDPEPVLAALKGIELPEGDGYVWIASEAKVAKSAHIYMVNERNHPKAWLKAGGYWQKGTANSHEKFE